MGFPMDFSRTAAARTTAIRTRADAARARAKKTCFLNRLREFVDPIKLCQSSQSGHEA
jgi:hypothetical protein